MDFQPEKHNPFASRPGQIERRIEHTRSQLVRDIDELKAVVRENLNWRLQIDRHPRAAAGIALAAGLLLGLLMLPFRSRPRPIYV